jgi:DNA-binding NarL/FixJ family response regulator
VTELERFGYGYAEYQRLLEQCPFTDEERRVFDLRRRGKSVVEISMALNMSPRTVGRRLDSVKNKIAKEA